MASTTSTAQNGVNGTDSGAPAHHEAHNPTVEEVPDESELNGKPHPQSEKTTLESVDDAAVAPTWAATPSAKAAGKRKAEEPTSKDKRPVLDTQSSELFPGLGGSKPAAAPSFNKSWGKGPVQVNGRSNGTPTTGASTPTSDAPTPPLSRGAPQSLASQIQAPLLVLQKHEVLPRTQMKKPLSDILKDINKKLRTNLTMTQGAGGVLEFRETSNAKEPLKQQAIRDLGQQIGVKSSVKVAIPRSARAHIIGKGGSMIKSLQESTGARIQMPKMDDEPADEDDDIDIVVEGNPMSVLLAKKAIESIANERSANVNTKLRTIPAEFYPFISRSASDLEDSHKVRIEIPPHSQWLPQSSDAATAGQPPVFVPAGGDNHISLNGDRLAVHAARAEIERLAEQLRTELAMRQFSLSRGQRDFVVGNRGMTPQDFLAQTQCALIMPPNASTDEVTIVGPAASLAAGIDFAEERASAVSNSDFSFSLPPVVARNFAQYLKERQEIERMEKAHEAYIVTSVDEDGEITYEILSQSGLNNKRAKDSMKEIFRAHPKERMAPLDVDPFFHAHLRRTISPEVRQQHGVHIVIPDGSPAGAPVLLVFEGPSSAETGYEIPRTLPTAQEKSAFKQGLADARTRILDIISKQAEIISTTIDVPRVHHDKLKKFIKEEQASRAEDEIPVRVSAAGTLVTLRGPAPAVESLAAKVNAFVEAAIADEKERGFVLPAFDFPQKHANQLIGKGGSHIRELRDKFDVEINVNEGQVELKGPKAKAEACKHHIQTLARQWADETTYTLKVDPKFHSELIGAQGALINRLQTKYKVQIHFPRSAKPVRDDQSSADAASVKGGRRDQAPDEVIVKGPKKGADEAREEILSLLQYYKDNSHEEKISVQASQIPSLIGQRGSGMDEIRQVSGARIDIPKAAKDQDPSARIEISIKGTKAQAQQAKKMIDEKRAVYDSTVVKSVEVDKKHHRALIGAGGSALRDIVGNAGGSDDKRELAKTVQFPKADADGNTIKVSGKEDLVDKIIAAMQQIVIDRESQTTETIDVPTDKHRSLIGRGGETKKDLEAKFKVAIDIPRQGSEQSGIKITGQPKDVEAAKAHIIDITKEQAGETVQVPRKVHHSVSDNGQFFRKLRNDHQVTVDHAGAKLPPRPSAEAPAWVLASDMPLITDEDVTDAHQFKTTSLSGSNDDGEIPWVFRGSPEGIAKAKTLLAAAIEQASKNDTMGHLTLPDPSTYRYVIGQGGSKVNSIRKATGCKITVPRDQAANQPIEIIGSAEGVEKARQLILKAVQDGSNNNNNGGGNRGANGRYGTAATTANGNGNWD
ncbi:uncharacterized protein LY89DRAFT_785807 [Mollisia scopiformis]|uniref:K Homology domain-containing protein n=1 Tax=Mollisia scopiformis TaxID=149040 RepID=A0A194WWU4_MOLSC|nr:uncharacterized protein LY89DRAFT_785807 [Mollisia scopiformis]KUJ12448.1 hypothetical protein LY89DRAFT_785807 [Mollisia scopiformis]